MLMDNFVLKMEGISKYFPGVKALTDVSFTVKKGEVHALVGENGAGKSTLMKVLNGVYQANAGEIFVEGQHVKIANVNDAQALGLSLIYQEFNLINTLSVAENIYLGKLKLKKSKTIDWKTVNTNAAALIDKLGFSIDVTRRVSTLSTAEKQLVEIAKALSINAKIIVMDEPTSSLSKNETEKLFDTIARLKQEGVTVIYISHRMEEIFRICDTVTILRDGRVIDSRPIADLTREQIIEKMVGRTVEMEFPKRKTDIGEVVLEAKNIVSDNGVNNVSFALRKGEILGIAGLVGAGRTELAETLFGAAKILSGELFVKGKKAIIRNPGDGKLNSIGMLTEDRKETGLVLGFDLAKNISITNLDEVEQNKLMLSNKKEKIKAGDYIKQLNIRTPSVTQKALNLSGGNQQKVVLAKWLFSGVDILIMDEPTRGIDVGAKYEIYLLMNKLVEQGKSLIMISSELPEVLGMSDRVFVMHNGQIKGELNKDEMTPEAVMNLAID